MTDRQFWIGCPAVEIDDGKLHGEPAVGSYRVAARTIVECEELGETPEETAQNYDLPVDQVRTILSYYHAHQPELTPSR